MNILEKNILASCDWVYEIQKELTACAALGPENSGNGELAKAEFIEKQLRLAGISDIRRYDSPDDRVACGFRPNLVGRVQGSSSRTLWLFAHMDVVPAGDGWKTDPWTVFRDGDRIWGRGVEDNQQAICSMLLLAFRLSELGIQPSLSLGLVFLSDEECGSRHGLQWLLEADPGLFGHDDLFIVPDGGSASASLIEVAEKAQLWIKFTVNGAQCHASTPHKGRNAFVAASRLVLELDELNKKFDEKNGLFKPPCSTFTPTRHECNVEGVNILPGKDIFYLDCRLLPELKPETVLDEIGRIVGKLCSEPGITINFEVVQQQNASCVPLSTPVISMLKNAIMAVYGVYAREVGIGGATVSAFLRQLGYPAVVWSCILNTCHQPDEQSSLAATCRDAAVFARVLQAGLAGGRENG